MFELFKSLWGEIQGKNRKNQKDFNRCDIREIARGLSEYNYII